MLKIHYLIVLLLLYSCNVSKEKSALKLPAKTQLPISEPPPEGFVILPSSKRFLNRNQDCNKIWQVFKEGDTTKIREQDKSAPITILPFKIDEPLRAFYHHVQQVDDGWLIGFDRGEWGGDLLWFNIDGSKKKILLFNENVRGLVKSSTGIFVVTGLNHLAIYSGKIFHVQKREDGNWNAKLLVDFRGIPHTFTQESTDSLLVVAGNRNKSSLKTSDTFVEEPDNHFVKESGDLWRVKTNGKVDSLLISDRLSTMQPNSMTLSQTGVIYLGAWRFVARLTPLENGYKEEIFVPPTCY